MFEKQQASIGQGIAIMTGVTLASRAGAIVLSVILIKILEPGQLGLFLGIQAMVFVGCALCDLGLSQGYRMLVSRDQSLRRSLLGTTLFIQGLALIIYLFGLSGHLFTKGMLSFPVVLIALGALISQWITTPDLDLQVFRQFRKASVLKFFPVFGLALATLLCFLSQDKLNGLAIGYALGMIVTGIVAIVLLGSWNLSIQFNKQYLFLIRTSILFFFSILLYQIAQFWGLTYVLVTQGEHAAGILGLPYKLYLLFMILSGSTTSVTLPLFHKLVQDGAYEMLGIVLTRLLGPLWAIAGTAAGICILSPKLIVRVFASSEYMESVDLIPVLGVAFLVKTLAVPAGNVLETRNLQWLRLIGQTVSTTAIVVTITTLLPHFGLITVAITTLCVDSFLFLWYWGFNVYKIGPYLKWGVQARALLSLIVAVGIGWTLPWNDVSKIVFFVVAYMVLLKFLGVIKIQELNALIRTKR